MEKAIDITKNKKKNRKSKIGNDKLIIKYNLGKWSLEKRQIMFGKIWICGKIRTNNTEKVWDIMDYERIRKERLLERFLNGTLPQDEYDALSKKEKEWLDKERKRENFKNSLKVTSTRSYLGGLGYVDSINKKIEENIGMLMK